MKGREGTSARPEDRAPPSLAGTAGAEGVREESESPRAKLQVRSRVEGLCPKVSTECDRESVEGDSGLLR